MALNDPAANSTLTPRRAWTAASPVPYCVQAPMVRAPGDARPPSVPPSTPASPGILDSTAEAFHDTRGHVWRTVAGSRSEPAVNHWASRSIGAGLLSLGERD